MLHQQARALHAQSLDGLGRRMARLFAKRARELPGAEVRGLGQAVHVEWAAPGKIVMRAEGMVDAALAGFDQGEFITIPSLPDAADLQAYEDARQKLMPNLSRRQPAPRYGVAA